MPSGVCSTRRAFNSVGIVASSSIDEEGIAHLIAAGDVIARSGERSAGGPLLLDAMHRGERLPLGGMTLSDARTRREIEVDYLPARLRALSSADRPYEVRTSTTLIDEAESLRRYYQQAIVK
jgi:hypothetical protein